VSKLKDYLQLTAESAALKGGKESDESKVEIINDINSDLITLYRVIKNHLDESIRYLRWILVSRDEFDRFKREAPSSLTDIQRAVRFYYLARMGYGGKIVKPTFTPTPTRPPRLNLLRIEEDLSQAHLRLARVYIENLPYTDLIRRYDRPGTFFYIDPPYWGCEDDYGKGIFSPSDFSLLASLLSGLTGKWIMSINDTPEIRALFSDFPIHEVTTTYLAGGAAHKKPVTELLIMNSG
jgi:DNA adenine methylase